MGLGFVRNRQLAKVSLTEDLRAEIGSKSSNWVAHAIWCLLPAHYHKNRSHP